MTKEKLFGVTFSFKLAVAALASVRAGSAELIASQFQSQGQKIS